MTDVLMYQPDFVAVDFSVNDLEVPFRQETYEGVVRKLLTWPSHPAVVLLNNIYYDTGETSQDEHNAVGDHYGVPTSASGTAFTRICVPVSMPAAPC